MRLDCWWGRKLANLRWQVPHQPAIGYQVTLNGQLLGATTTQVFALKDLDPNANYTAEVRTAWQDGKISEKKAELKFTLKQLLPQEVFLSELSPLRLTAGWRQTEFNRNFNSGGLSIGGRPFEKGLGMPTNSEIEYELNGTYEKFSALVGIDDEHNNKDSVVEFSVLGDGKELWRSGGWKKADGAKTVKVDVKNVRRLMLRVKREGEGGGCMLIGWMRSWLSEVWRFYEVANVSGDRVRLPDPELSYLQLLTSSFLLELFTSVFVM